MGLEFTIGEGNDRRKVSTKELLARTVFYKVGHHGSGNATLRAGLEAMTSEDLVAAIPTDERFAREVKGWEMPAPKLWKALGEKTKGRILRADPGSMPSRRKSRRTSARRRGIVSVEPSRPIRCLSITSCDREADVALWFAGRRSHTSCPTSGSLIGKAYTGVSANRVHGYIRFNHLQNSESHSPFRRAGSDSAKTSKHALSPSGPSRQKRPFMR